MNCGCASVNGGAKGKSGSSFIDGCLVYQSFITFGEKEKMRIMILLGAIFCSFIALANDPVAISNVKFTVNSKGIETTYVVDENDTYEIYISSNFTTINFTNDGGKTEYFSSEKGLNYLSYEIDGKLHEFELVEGSIKLGVGATEKYSVLLEKIHETEHFVLYFSPYYDYTETNTRTKESINDVRRNHYITYGENTVSRHDGTLGSLTMRLGWVNGKSKARQMEACKESVRNHFNNVRHGLSEEEMIEVIDYWEANCM